MPGKRRVREEFISLSWVLSAALGVLFCDQASKYFLLGSLKQGASIPVIKNIFHLTLVFNTGAAFGIFNVGANNYSPLLIAFGIAAMAFLMVLLPRVLKADLVIKIAYAFMLGGISGNLIDRIRFGYVVDFLDFRIWPVFNIADSAICIGVALLCMKMLKSRRGAPCGRPDNKGRGNRAPTMRL
jgi:signal peptidase II